jgi:hypothetical protein
MRLNDHFHDVLIITNQWDMGYHELCFKTMMMNQWNMRPSHHFHDILIITLQ